MADGDRFNRMVEDAAADPPPDWVMLPHWASDAEGRTIGCSMSVPLRAVAFPFIAPEPVKFTASDVESVVRFMAGVVALDAFPYDPEPPR